MQDSKVQLSKHEHSLKSIDTKIDDSKVKLNQVKKNDEYKALQNQIAHDQTHQVEDRGGNPPRLRRHRIQGGRPQEARRRGQAGRRRRHALQKQLEEQVVAHKTQLQELETAIVERRGPDPGRVSRKLPADRRAIRGRCAGRLRECVMQWLFHVADVADDQRPHQR